MRVRRIDDVGGFMALADPVLMRDEARHNLHLGTLATLRDRPDVYAERRFWIVEQDDDVVGVALRTPPFRLLVAQSTHDGALEALADHLVAGNIHVPGVVAAEPEASRFANAWSARTGAETVVRVQQTIHRLERILPTPISSGGARVATRADLGLLERWLDAFMAEVLPHEPVDDARHRALEARLTPDADSGIWLWEDGNLPVSMAGFSGPTPNGMRVGPVYTPPASRGRGYATSLVAALSARLLRHGRRYCFLYTDRANPTSNAIYRAIGYKPVCEAADIEFLEAKGRHGEMPPPVHA
jgi:predicted GNAT family acetyltransferase